MIKTYHPCLDIRGALRKSDTALSSLNLYDHKGRWMSLAETRKLLRDHLQQGHRVLPMSDECVGFSYESGCPGHEKEDGE